MTLPMTAHIIQGPHFVAKQHSGPRQSRSDESGRVYAKSRKGMINIDLRDVTPYKLRPRTYVYILKLEKNKWYVGYTKTKESRLRNHFNGGGSKWTKKYKPTALAEIIYGNKKLETEITIRMMAEFGVDNVRGADWCHTVCDIPKAEKRRIRKLMKRYERED